MMTLGPIAFATPWLLPDYPADFMATVARRATRTDQASISRCGAAAGSDR